MDGDYWCLNKQRLISNESSSIKKEAVGNDVQTMLTTTALQRLEID